MNKFALGCGVLIAILLFIVVVAAIAVGGSYNRLVRLQQAVDQNWAQVQNVYQRRADPWWKSRMRARVSAACKCSSTRIKRRPTRHNCSSFKPHRGS
ncbi:MAG: hypothetical protein DMF08_12925 [Verrucomicrobia bacterium]|nr:MAG: hypothetical protein DMF08_12925 [Verrucomicrobiota bacterium]